MGVLLGVQLEKRDWMVALIISLSFTFLSLSQRLARITSALTAEFTREGLSPTLGILLPLGALVLYVMLTPHLQRKRASAVFLGVPALLALGSAIILATTEGHVGTQLQVETAASAFSMIAGVHLWAVAADGYSAEKAERVLSVAIALSALFGVISVFTFGLLVHPQVPQAILLALTAVLHILTFLGLRWLARVNPTSEPGARDFPSLLRVFRSRFALVMLFVVTAASVVSKFRGLLPSSVSASRESIEQLSRYVSLGQIAVAVFLFFCFCRLIRHYGPVRVALVAFANENF